MTGDLLLRAMDDEQLFGKFFAGPTWRAWRTFIAALHGLSLPDPDLYANATGRFSIALPQDVSEAWIVAGRRSGKSRIASLLAVFCACFKHYTLAPGERGVVMLLAADRKQARVLMRYVLGLIDTVPMLQRMVTKTTQESIELDNGIVIEVHTASFRSVRGYTVVAAICDEIAFWRTDDSANPDREILDALRPALATVPNSLLLCLSSPYARRGELYRTYERHWGNEGSPVLVWRADTRTMNPSVSEQVIAAAYDRDAAAAATEYGAEFRSDLSAAFDDALIAAATELGVQLREPTTDPGMHARTYRAFVDPAGGSGKDSYTVAVAHAERGTAVLDAVLEVRPPFSTDRATEQAAALLARYGIRSVMGDRYGGDWPAQALAKHGIEYVPSERAKSELYLEAVPLFSSGRVRLLDNERLLNQIRQLERRTGRAGRDSIDHPPGAHDDLANAAIGAIVRAAERRDSSAVELDFVFSDLARDMALNLDPSRPTLLGDGPWN